MKLEQTFPVLIALAEHRGINVIWKNLVGGYNGFWEFQGGVESIILGEHLQKDPEKKTIVLAHELGHAILHKNNFDATLYWQNSMHNEYALRKEQEADIFARALMLGSAVGIKFGA